MIDRRLFFGDQEVSEILTRIVVAVAVVQIREMFVLMLERLVLVGMRMPGGWVNSRMAVVMVVIQMVVAMLVCCRQVCMWVSMLFYEQDQDGDQKNQRSQAMDQR